MTVPKLYQLWRCLQAFQKVFPRNYMEGSNEHQTQHLKSWGRDRLSHALVSIQYACPQDAAALIEMIKEYDDKMLDEIVGCDSDLCFGAKLCSHRMKCSSIR